MKQPHNSRPKVTFELVNGDGFSGFTVTVGNGGISADLLEKISEKYGFLTEEIEEVCSKSDHEITPLLSQRTLPYFRQIFEGEGCEVEVVPPDSDPQLEHGYTRLANELIERMTKVRLSGQEWAVWAMIARETYGWAGKKKSKDTIWRTITISRIIERTGIAEREVYRAVNSLLNKNMVERREATSITATGLKRTYQYRIQKYGGQWKCDFWIIPGIDDRHRRNKPSKSKEKPIFKSPNYDIEPKGPLGVLTGDTPGCIDRGSTVDSIDSQGPAGSERNIYKENNIVEIDEYSEESSSHPDHPPLKGRGSKESQDLGQVEKRAGATTPQSSTTDESPVTNPTPRPEPTPVNMLNTGATVRSRGRTKKGKGDPRINDLKRKFLSIHLEEFGLPGKITHGRDEAILKRLLKDHPYERIERAIKILAHWARIDKGGRGWYQPFEIRTLDKCWSELVQEISRREGLGKGDPATAGHLTFDELKRLQREEEEKERAGQ